MNEVRVLLVDDYPPFLNTLADRLSTDNRFRIVGRASSGVEALNEARRLRPDLILMDVTMASMNGLEATRRLKADQNAPCVVLLSMEPDAARERAARTAGADGVIFKYELDQRLLPLLDQLIPISRQETDHTPSQNAIRDYVQGQLSEFERYLQRSDVSQGTIDLWLQGARNFAKFMFGGEAFK